MKGKKITAFITAVLMAALSAAGCSGNGQDNSSAPAETESVPETAAAVADVEDKDALLIGAEGLKGVFNPLFAQTEADKKVCNLIFDTVCSIDQLGELEDAAGHFAPAEEAADEESGETDGETGETACYQLTLNKGLKFSDGTDLTIDDVIFSWKLMADPYYSGTYSLAEVPVVGMQEYYYDTNDVETYKKNLTKNYSSKKISREDFIAYLIDTRLDGWFDGELPGDLDGKGMTWVEYLQSNGYDTAGIEEDADALLELLAQCEYEHYSFSYDPYTYYQEKAHNDLLAGGVEVADIAGIKKIDDYTCTVAFSQTAPDAETLRAMTVIPILSEEYYGADYEKGAIEDLKKLNTSPVGSGAYAMHVFSDDSVSLKAADNSRMKAASPYVKLKDIAEEEKAQALKNGTIALASLQLNSTLEQAENLEITPVQGSGFYYLGINTDMVNRPGVRKGIMALVDKSLIGASNEEILQILKSAGSSASGSISDSVSLTTQTWPMTRLSAYYPNIKELLENPAANVNDETVEAGGESEAGGDEMSGTDTAEEDLYEYSVETASGSFASEGYWNDGSILVRNGEQLKLNMGISQELPACIKAIAWKLKADMEELGAEVSLKEYTEGEMEATIPTAAFDLWIGKLTGLADYDMEDYLKYGGEKNYFHHQNGYADMLFAEIRETEDDYDRAGFIKEMLGDIMDGDCCRPLCEEISEVYAANTSLMTWKDTPRLNEYDSFAEIICGIEQK